MVNIAENLQSIRSSIPNDVTLVAISKYHPAEALRQAYDAGQRIFGESREQEMNAKHQELASDITWHFIGHLQRNKVKYIAPYVSLIHSADTPQLLIEIEKQAQRNARTIPVLLQVHIAREESKSGFIPDELRSWLDSGVFQHLSHTRIEGLMGMASNSEDEQLIHKEFHSLRTLFEEVRNGWFSGSDSFSILSMGMSGDYRIAIEEGSTMVRIGSAIFGERQY